MGNSFVLCLDANTIKEHRWFFNTKFISEAWYATHYHARSLDKYNSNDQKYSLADVAYIGDDIPDITCMKHILNAGGIVGCPKNAIEEILKIANYISPHNGGEGAVRDYIEWIIRNSKA